MKRPPPQEAARRKSAQGQRCTLRIPTVCNRDPQTTVYCHSNRLEHGKGMGLKASIGVYGCSACHDVLDGRAPRPDFLSYDELQQRFDMAWEETRAILEEKGLI